MCMLNIYTASSTNRKELLKQRTILKRLFNSAVLHNRHDEIKTLTMTYALLYSAFAETAFVKMIHTPHGFSPDYIRQIQHQRNLTEKWTKCIELAFSSMLTQTNSGQIANKKQTLLRLLNRYIIEPSHIRNKLAHGQWKVALNTDTTAINVELTCEIDELDFVKVDCLFSVYEKFSNCIEDLIESPPTHHRDYYSTLSDLESFIDQTKNWTFESRVSRIKNTKNIYIHDPGRSS